MCQADCGCVLSSVDQQGQLGLKFKQTVTAHSAGALGACPMVGSPPPRMALWQPIHLGAEGA